MARTTRPWWPLVVGLVVSIVAGRDASATTFVLMDEGELAARSVAVVTGTVQLVHAAADEETGGVNSYVYIEPDGVLAGAVPDGTVVLRETGGRVADREEFVYGTPEYVQGERVLAFLSRHADGSLRTTAMAMGKYRLDSSTGSHLRASRTFGSGVTVLRRLQRDVTVETASLEDVIARIHEVALEEDDGYSAPVQWRPGELDRITPSFQASFTLLGSPSRWFEPDFGLPVLFAIDGTGDPKVGPVSSRTAVLNALAAWTAVPQSLLELQPGETIPPMPFAGCDGGNRIIFNDPFDEITDPTNCGGILAIGGYCGHWQTATINGVNYRRIGVGKIMMNNGWDKCSGWNACNLAEVLTHEVGHAIGLGHSTVQGSTMSPNAHFDGRCAHVAADDMDGARSLYGDPDAPTLTPTPSRTPTPHMFAVPSQTRTPTASRTPTATRTATATRTETRSATATRTRTATVLRSATVTRTVTPTRTPTVVRSATSTRTPSSTRTPTRSRTVTRTRTETRTRTATRTRTVTRTRTATRTPTPTRAALAANTVGRTPTATRTRTSTRAATATRTVTNTRTATRTRTETRTRTQTRTRTATRTRTPSRTGTSTRTPTATPTPRGASGAVQHGGGQPASDGISSSPSGRGSAAGWVVR